MNKISASVLLAFLVMSLVIAIPKKMVKPPVNRLSTKKAVRHMSRYYDASRVEEMEQKLDEGYGKYSQEDGFELLSREEHLKLGLEVVNPQLNHPYTEEQIQNWFTALDLDGSGQLTREEYIPITAVSILVTQDMADA